MLSLLQTMCSYLFKGYRSQTRSPPFRNRS